jgi:AbrB family looped-hinge helix DNA binding protein
MAEQLRVKVSSRYHITLPGSVRKQLNIDAGDHLLIDVQEGMLILIPQPENYTEYMEGLHREVWEDIDTDAYLREERDAWDQSDENSSS